jgi:hypothetical protein
VQGCEIGRVHVQVLPKRSHHRPNSRRLSRGSPQQLRERNGFRPQEADQTLHGRRRRQIAEMVEIAEHLQIRGRHG